MAKVHLVPRPPTLSSSVYVTIAEDWLNVFFALHFPCIIVNATKKMGNWAAANEMFFLLFSRNVTT